MKRHRKIKKLFGRTSTRPQALAGIEATRWTPTADMIFWPTLDTRREVNGWDRQRLYESARSLYANSPRIRKVVEIIVNLQGWLMPLPRTQDAEWNRLARAAFLTRAGNAELFDVAGKLNFRTAQLWAEKNRAIDGDCLIVLARARDGGPATAYYKAPQIRGDENASTGVLTDENGRALSYGVYNYLTEQTVAIPATAALLYQHDPDPGRDRGVSDLIAAIPHGRDLAEIFGYLKAGVKLASSIGLVETKAPNDRKSGMTLNLGAATTEATPAPQPQTILGGTRIVSLEPGRDIKAIKDDRPTNGNMVLIDNLVAEIAHSVGLDPTVLFDSTKLGSAGTRFDLEKLKRWLEKRKLWREDWVNRVYRYVLAGEMAAGRLRPCRDRTWENVEWIPCRDMTIDMGREGTLAINLNREGMGDADHWALRTEGMTQEDLLRRRAYNVAVAQQLAAEYGISMADLLPGSVGATSTPAPVPPPDEEPEGGTGASPPSREREK